VPLAELSLGEVEDLLWGVGFGESAAAMVEGHSIDGARNAFLSLILLLLFFCERGLCQSEYTHFFMSVLQSTNACIRFTSLSSISFSTALA
jgi:hypothetical protein